jgi:hypothetical protein
MEIVASKMASGYGSRSPTREVEILAMSSKDNSRQQKAVKINIKLIMTAYK